MTLEVVNNVTRNFGPRDTEHQRGGRTTTFGEVREIVVDFNYDSLPTNSTTDATVPTIPAFSFILDTYLLVKTAFAGGTSYAVGLVQADGTAIDADGLITDANAPLTNIADPNQWIKGSGALISPGPNAGPPDATATTGISSVAGQIKVTATGTFTAGAAKLVVRYIGKA